MYTNRKILLLSSYELIIFDPKPMYFAGLPELLSSLTFGRACEMMKKQKRICELLFLYGKSYGFDSSAIKYIITIVETGSITMAAERLFVAQPSLSKAVAELVRE